MIEIGNCLQCKIFVERFLMTGNLKLKRDWTEFLSPRVGRKNLNVLYPKRFLCKEKEHKQKLEEYNYSIQTLKVATKSVVCC